MKQHKRPLQNKVRLVLSSLCVILGVILWLELNNQKLNKLETDQLDAGGMIKDKTKNNREFIFSDIIAFDEIIKRPLFNKKRLPFVTLESQQTGVKTHLKNNQNIIKQDQLSLSAVVISPDTQIAILQKGRGKMLQRISIGETIDGWTLEDVTPHSIRLKKGKETKSLELEIKNSTIKKTPVAKSKEVNQSNAPINPWSANTKEQITARNTAAETATKEK